MLNLSSNLKLALLGVLACSGLAVLTACASKAERRPVSTTVRPVELPPTASSNPASRSSGSGNAPAGSAKTPIADRAINVAGNCSQTEEDGFRENAQVQIDNNQVRSLSWKIWVGKRGQCSFEGTDFSQTQSRPHIELMAKDGSGCKLMVWQTPQRVTLAHSDCQKRCTAGIYDDAWPVMFHPQTGACARVG